MSYAGVLPGILIAVVILIVYGSLYPWHFEYRDLPSNPVWMMLHSWGIGTGRRFLADIAVNVALYVPLGMTGYLALKRWRIAGAVLLGFVVSFSVETVQLYTPGRVSSAVDLTNNVIGTLVGVCFGLLFEKLAGPDVIEFGAVTAGHRGALALLFCWVCTLLFPFYPETHLGNLWADWAGLAEGPLWGTASVLALLTSFAKWFVAGMLLKAADFRFPRQWLVILLLLLLPAQFLVVTHRPNAAEFLGAAMGVILYCWLGGRVRRSRAAAWLYIGLLVARGVMPFHLGDGHTFSWIPFGGFLETPWQYGIQVLLEKTLYYGTSLWLLRSSGTRLPAATAMMGAILLAIEIVQTHLPGRSSEITEPILCVLIGLGLWALNPHRRSDAVLLRPVRR